MDSPTYSHSANVQLELRVDGQKVPLAQLGADFAIPRVPGHSPIGNGEIVMVIDGEISRIPVVVEKCEAGRIWLGRRNVA